MSVDTLAPSEPPSTGIDALAISSFNELPHDASDELDISPELLAAYLDEIDTSNVPHGIDPTVLKANAAIAATRLLEETFTENDTPLLEMTDSFQSATGRVPFYDYVEIDADPKDPSHFVVVGNRLRDAIHKDMHIVMVGKYGGMSQEVADDLKTAIEDGDDAHLELYAKAAFYHDEPDSEFAQPVFNILSVDQPRNIDTFAKLVVSTLLITRAHESLGEERERRQRQAFAESA